MSESTNNRKEYAPFTVTTGRGFVRDFKQHDRQGADPLYFTTVALITGKEGSGNEAKSRCQYIDLLVGRALHSVVKKAIADGQNPFERFPVNVEIHNLHFTADPADDGEKVYLNNLGVLNDISFGYRRPRGGNGRVAPKQGSSAPSNQVEDDFDDDAHF